MTPKKTKNNLKAALISLGSTSSKWISKAMKNYFHEVEELDIRDFEISLGAKPEVLYKGDPLKNYDCIYLRGSFRYVNLLSTLTSLLKKEKTYLPLCSESYTVGHDKLLTQIKLQEMAVPSPKTYISSTPKAGKEILEKVDYPIIMKFPHGTQGKGVMFADSFPSASSMLDALSSLKQPFLIQEYIETESVDIRAIVVGEKVVASMKRIGTSKEKRANIHTGGKGEACQIDSHTKRIAVQAAKAVGAEICGVDILESIKGPVVIEVNLSPGLQGITKATKVDIADKMARYLFQRTLEEREKAREKEGNVLEKIGLENAADHKEIVTNLQFRGSKILLPEIITELSGFSENVEYSVKIEKNKIQIKKI